MTRDNSKNISIIIGSHSPSLMVSLTKYVRNKDWAEHWLNIEANISKYWRGVLTENTRPCCLNIDKISQYCQTLANIGKK